MSTYACRTSSSADIELFTEGDKTSQMQSAVSYTACGRITFRLHPPLLSCLPLGKKRLASTQPV